MDSIFIQISTLLAIVIGLAFILRFLRQPLMVAYLFAGIICGPFVLNLWHADYETYEVFAQFGVILLLFIIGLNLNFNHLKSIGKASVISGLGQVVFTASIGFVILLAIKVQLIAALYLAFAITFSSTIIIMKLLSDKKDTDTVYGRHTIGLMLVQDIIAVFLVIGLGLLIGQNNGGVFLIFLIFKLLVVCLLLYLVSVYILPKFMDKIANSSELLFLFSLAWCFSIASILYLLGFSLEIGAIISGIALSSSPYQPEIGSRIKPLRDFFLVLFFIVLGSEMSFTSLEVVLVPSLIISFFILIGNPLILYIIFRKLKFTRRNSFLSGLTAAQVSEFGFVLLFAGRQAGHIQGNEVAIFTGVAIITIFVSSYLIYYNDQIYHWLQPWFNLFAVDKHKQTEKIPPQYDAWIVGYHRIGTKVAEAMFELKKNFAIIDFDPSAIDKLKKEKLPFYFGDIGDVEFLESLPIENSQIIIMTIPSVDDQVNLIKYARKSNKKILIIANAYYKADARILYAKGADYVMMPHLLGGQWIANILKEKRWNKKNLVRFKSEQNKMLKK